MINILKYLSDNGYTDDLNVGIGSVLLSNLKIPAKRFDKAWNKLKQDGLLGNYGPAVYITQSGILFYKKYIEENNL